MQRSDGAAGDGRISVAVVEDTRRAMQAWAASPDGTEDLGAALHRLARHATDRGLAADELLLVLRDAAHSVVDGRRDGALDRLIAACIVAYQEARDGDGRR